MGPFIKEVGTKGREVRQNSDKSGQYADAGNGTLSAEKLEGLYR